MLPPSPSARAASGTGARLLALDCSTDRLVLALGDGARRFGADEAGGPLASERLLPALHDLLAEAGLVLGQLDAIAFARGPGAFTGLRTACAAAQGLALGLDRPVLPLDSLMLVAEDRWGAQPPDGACWVAMDARMGEVYAAAYRWSAGAWLVVDAPALWPLAALVERWQHSPPLQVAGSALEAFGERLPTGDALRHPHAHDRAGALLRLAQRAHAAGQGVDAAAALPLYLRDRVALTTAQREAAR